MSTLDALRRGVDNYPGGREVVAVRIGKTGEVLRKELSGAASHKLGAVDALTIARIACEEGRPHCYDYAAMVAQECGGRFEAKTGTAEHGETSHAFVHYKFTAKGVEWVAGLWGSHKARLAQEGSAST